MSRDLESRLTNALRSLDQAEQERVPLLQRALVAGVSIQTLTSFTVTVPTDWVTVGAAGAPAYQGTWAAYGGGRAGAKFRKTPSGDTVELAGEMKAGTIGTAAFTLPSAYIPDDEGGGSFFGVYTYDGATIAPGEITISSSGALAPNFGNNTEVSLWGVRFAAKDRTPVTASCWPVDVAHSLAVAPVEVRIASCVDTANSASPAVLPPLWLSWIPTPGVPNSIRVQAITGLLPTHTYSITLEAWGA